VYRIGQRRRSIARGGHFADAVGDGGDFEDWIDLCGNAAELPALVEKLNKTA
jgi:hypothetical protein